MISTAVSVWVGVLVHGCMCMAACVEGVVDANMPGNKQSDCCVHSLFSTPPSFLSAYAWASSTPVLTVGLQSGLPRLDVCKSLESADYVRLLWTSAAEVPGILITMLILTFIGRKIVIGVEMLIVTLFTGLLFLCIDE